MEPKVNYTAVGLFVVVLTIALVYLIFWLTADVSHKSYSTYLTYINESVSGLTEESSVKYNGVDIGYVKTISLTPNNPQQVRLVLEIESDIIIHEDTTATIQVQGLTGVAYVGLQGGEASSPVLEVKPDEPYPVIKSSPSLLFRVDTAMRELTTSLSTITNSISAILDKQNQAAFKQSLQNIEKVTQVLADHSKKLDATIVNLDIIMKNTAHASNDLPQLVKSAQQSVQAIKTMSNDLSVAGNEVSQTMRTSRVAIASIANQLLPETVIAIGKISDLSSNLQALSAELKQDPSILIRGKAPGALGPGESS